MAAIKPDVHVNIRLHRHHSGKTQMHFDKRASKWLAIHDGEVDANIACMTSLLRDPSAAGQADCRRPHDVQ